MPDEPEEQGGNWKQPLKDFQGARPDLPNGYELTQWPIRDETECARCRGFGSFYVRYPQGLRKEPCPDCGGVSTEEQIQERFVRSRTPSSLLDSMDWSTTDWSMIMEARLACDRFLRGATNILTLVGQPGSGKTHLAVALAKELMRQGKAVVWCKVPEFLEDLRQSFEDKSGMETRRLMDGYKAAPIILLDDLGSHRANEWVNERVFLLVSHLYDEERPIIVTTENFDGVDDRIVSRLCDERRGNRVKLPNKDWRRGSLRLPQPLAPLSPQPQTSLEEPGLGAPPSAVPRWVADKPPNPKGRWRG